MHGQSGEGAGVSVVSRSMGRGGMGGEEVRKGLGVGGE